MILSFLQTKIYLEKRILSMGIKKIINPVTRSTLISEYDLFTMVSLVINIHPIKLVTTAANVRNIPIGANNLNNVFGYAAPEKININKRMIPKAPMITPILDTLLFLITFS